MLLSHLGLTVSHISSSTSFYLAALQPLGYHYVGQQGDSIGIGIKDAELFLTQQHHGGRIAPTHIAFAANDRITVRDCYSAALDAGGRPSGAPGYRSNDCSCFNAAVEDLDGNTIEFIFRDHCESEDESHSLAPQQTSRAPASVRDDMQSLASKATQARSRAQVVTDLASAASKSTKKSNPPTPGITRSRTEPVTSPSTNSGKNLMGPLIGVAAGAALVYAAFSSERDSARDEADHASAMRSKAPSSQDTRRRSVQDKATTVTKPSNRDYGVAEPSRSSRKSPRSTRAIEATAYEDDYEVQEAISRYTSARSRPSAPQRSRTYDALEYVPRRRSSSQGDPFGMRRATTLPIEPDHYYIEAPRAIPSSQYSSRRRSSFDESKMKRHDSGVSMHSYRSRRSNEGRRRSSFGDGSTMKSSRRGSTYESAVEVPLPTSRATSRYTAATEQLSREMSKAPSRYTNATNNTARESSKSKSKAPTWISAAQKPLPQSQAPSYYSAAQKPLPQSRATSYISAAQVPVPASGLYGGYSDEGEESDGLSDMKTVVPDDSISCVDFYAPKRKDKSKSSSYSKSSKQSSSKRSEAESERTVRLAKRKTNSSSRQSAATLPVRAKEDQYSRGGKRSTYTYT